MHACISHPPSVSVSNATSLSYAVMCRQAWDAAVYGLVDRYDLNCVYVTLGGSQHLSGWWRESGKHPPPPPPPTPHHHHIAHTIGKWRNYLTTPLPRRLRSISSAIIEAKKSKSRKTMVQKHNTHNTCKTVNMLRPYTANLHSALNSCVYNRLNIFMFLRIGIDRPRNKLKAENEENVLSMRVPVKK